MTLERPAYRRAVPVWLIGGLAAVTVLAVVVVLHPGPLPGEVGYVRALQRLGGPALTVAEIVHTATGTEGVLVAAAIPLGWLLRTGGRSGLVVVVIVLGAMLVVQPVVKEVVARPRPSAETVDVRAGHDSSSFPSGHSLGTTTVYGSAAAALWVLRRRRWGVLAAAPIILTFCAGALLGVHWPSDAVAGTLLGAFAVWLLLPSLLAALRVGTERARLTS